MVTSICRLLAVAFLSLSLITSQAQPEPKPVPKELKPYKILTSGRQITIKCTKDINHVMLWTSGGNRVVEQREINNSQYSFTVPVSQKTFFLMIGLKNGKVYTEKVGIQ